MSKISLINNFTEKFNKSKREKLAKFGYKIHFQTPKMLKFLYKLYHSFCKDVNIFVPALPSKISVAYSIKFNLKKCMLIKRFFLLLFSELFLG